MTCAFHAATDLVTSIAVVFIVAFIIIVITIILVVGYLCYKGTCSSHV